MRLINIGIVSVVASSLLVPLATASTPPLPTMRGGNGPARVIRTTDVSDNARVTFYFGLRRDEAGAQRMLLSVSSPRSAQYMRYPKKLLVAKAFGASAQTVTKVKRMLRALGLVGATDSSRLFMRVRGTANDFERAFKMNLTATVYTGYTVISPIGKPVVPSKLRSLAPDRVWQSETQNTASVPNPTPPTPPSAPMTPLPSNTGTPIRYCPLIKSEISQVMTFQQAMTAYGVSGIKRQAPAARGDSRNRKQPPIGIIAMGSGFSPQMASYAQKCFGWDARITRRSSDGMKSHLAPLNAEGDLDVQMVGAVASKGWSVPVYEGLSSDTDPGQFLPTSKALNDSSTPSVLSISYGNCERSFRNSTGAPIRRIADSVYVRLGLIGTSVFVAAGDTGSSVCQSEGGSGGVSLSYPASSPWVTAVGGSQIALTKANRRHSEGVWNSWRNSVPGDPSTPVAPMAGTGGPSGIYRRPSWQSVTTGTKRRAVPDVTAHGAFGPSWIIFSQGEAFGVAGTSASTPFTASGFALVNAHRIHRGEPTLGFLNPMLYRAPKRAFFDVTQGTNDLWKVGCCDAKPGYDMASGRGAVRFDRLEQLLPSGHR